jgi:hypothetical protein
VQIVHLEHNVQFVLKMWMREQLTLFLRICFFFLNAQKLVKWLTTETNLGLCLARGAGPVDRGVRKKKHVAHNPGGDTLSSPSLMVYEIMYGNN